MRMVRLREASSARVELEFPLPTKNPVRLWIRVRNPWKMILARVVYGICSGRLNYGEVLGDPEKHVEKILQEYVARRYERISTLYDHPEPIMTVKQMLKRIANNWVVPLGGLAFGTIGYLCTSGALRLGELLKSGRTDSVLLNGALVRPGYYLLHFVGALSYIASSIMVAAYGILTREAVNEYREVKATIKEIIFYIGNFIPEGDSIRRSILEELFSWARKGYAKALMVLQEILSTYWMMDDLLFLTTIRNWDLFEGKAKAESIEMNCKVCFSEVSRNQRIDKLQDTVVFYAKYGSLGDFSESFTLFCLALQYPEGIMHCALEDVRIFEWKIGIEADFDKIKKAVEKGGIGRATEIARKMIDKVSKKTDAETLRFINLMAGIKRPSSDEDGQDN